ncbi:MAG: hypothetical protein IPI59_08950 [Sphingobacteriales bacterium]|jgi:hypothetical protein|nr:hypothetical protein [Sphingobacteriales bacterium]MBK8678650.1 hypothetical protein [Sphingobacteriales bacterium]MBP9141575.1 hypothetical protein [Chitinophagales bacterium]MCC7057632.1 hypothetical protein [Chitinophagales bacterium]MDA0198678.1 hypothetical protein [Bacteroidota bacterium]
MSHHEHPTDVGVDRLLGIGLLGFALTTALHVIVGVLFGFRANFMYFFYFLFLIITIIGIFRSK